MSDGARIAHYRATLRADHRQRLARKPGPIEPVGATPSMIRDARERACKCGTYVCSQRGPCAPPVAAPAAQPHAQPASEHAWARVGMRVRYRDAVAHKIAGVGEVTALDLGEVCWLGGDGKERCSRPRDLEPAEGKASEWTPEACGWMRVDVGGLWRGPSPKAYVYRSREWGGARVDTWDGLGRWRSFSANCNVDRSVEGTTLAQACCAALGITIERARGSGLWAAAGLLGDTHRVIVGYESACADAESCARAALDAYHARKAGEAR